VTTSSIIYLLSYVPYYYTAIQIEVVFGQASITIDLIIQSTIAAITLIYKVHIMKAQIVFALTLSSLAHSGNGFISHLPNNPSRTFGVIHHNILASLHMASVGGEEEGTFSKVTESESDIATPFVESGTDNYIDCNIDSVATVGGSEYFIGVPCDYSVALCYFDEEGGLCPADLDDNEMMDSVFPVAESIVEEEFGEELALMRTPQTLTLVGELELGGEEDDDYEFDLEDMDDEEEEVEILLSFDHDGKEFNLVRLLDPVLLVAKSDPGNVDARILLSPEESDKVMPYLEEMILDYQEEMDSQQSA